MQSLTAPDKSRQSKPLHISAQLLQVETEEKHQHFTQVEKNKLN